MPTFAFTPSATRPIVTPESINKALQTIIAPTLLQATRNCSPNDLVAEIKQMYDIFRRHRPWYNALTATRTLHPVILKLLSPHVTTLHKYITDWRIMLLEFPHISEVDPTMLAYVQSEEKAERGLYTRTSIGKFIKRHCPTMPDHELRDFVALYSDLLHNDPDDPNSDPNSPNYDPTKSKTMSFTHNLEQMVRVVQTGPKSCMKSSEWDDDPESHPYNVYAPKYGWHMAVRKSTTDGATVMGRCLCLTCEDGGVVSKFFVRSYMRNTDDPVNGYSGSDTQLEAWLKAQGYRHVKQWPTLTKLDAICVGDDDYLMPYLDGNNQRVDFFHTYFTVSSSGALEADSTDGVIDITAEADMESCDHCGDSTHVDNLYGVGEGSDCRVCEHCMENYYTLVMGRRRHEYYIAHEHAVYIQSHDAYYDVGYLDDNDIVWCDDEEEYYPLDEAWTCAATGTVYSNNTDYVEIDGDTYHPDHAPEVETEETTN